MKKTLLISSLYGTALALLSTFFLLQTFVFPSASGTMEENDDDPYDFDDDSGDSGDDPSGGGSTDPQDPDTPEAETTLSYEEKTRSVSGKMVPYMLVSVNLKKISDLRTRIAVDSSSSYGSNITESFSSMIEEAEKSDDEEILFAIDGDFPFWSGRSGYVIRNGTTLRSKARSDSSDLDLAVFKNGTFLAYDEADMDFETLLESNSGCYQNWCFGPALLKDSEINVTTTQDVSQTMSANQRVSMGYRDDGTLYFLCSDTNDGNRNRKSVGLSLYDMASIYKDLGCSIAYNFDGGGSAGMYIREYGQDGYYMEPSRSLGDMIYVVNS